MNLDSLRTVLTEAAPSTTVWIDARRGAENGDHEVQLRWQDLADRLRAAGAPDADIEALASAATRPTGRPDPSSRLLVARGGRVVLDEVVADTPPDGIGQVAFESLPDVEPLVTAGHSEVGFVVAKIDRVGADIEVFAALDAPAEDSATVKGRTLHVHKFGGGGWAHLRFQHNTEEAWRKNAEEVADAIHAKAQEHGVSLLVLGGDQRARTFAVEALPPGAGYDVVEVEGNVRAEGASEDTLDEAVITAVGARMTQGVEAVLDRLRAAREPMHDGTETGTAAVDVERAVAAFQQGQVAVLLLDPPALRARRLEVGPGPYELALPGGPRVWDGEAVSVPADLALVRAAVLTDADVQLVPAGSPDVPDGAAALLRWGGVEPQPAGTRNGVPLP
jgi:Bacterial archaeo-eukaryotic release factor family 2